jgi:hypothetical protein
MTRFPQRVAQQTDTPDEPQRLASWYTPGLSDALGDRLLMFDDTGSPSLELLRIKPELSRAEGFDEALRRRVEELADFTHPSLAKVRAVESLGEEDGLALISNHTVGRRLSEILNDAQGSQFAIELVRQLVPVLAALHEQGHGIAHGLLTPERVIVTPEGRLVLTEYVLASAVDALRLSPEKLREKLGLVMPPGVVTLDDPRADVVQLGYLALSLVIGRQVRSLDAAPEIVGLLNRQSLDRGRETPRYLFKWLVRALQVDGSSFESASDAERALRDWPQGELAEGPVRKSVASGSEILAQPPLQVDAPERRFWLKPVERPRSRPARFVVVEPEPAPSSEAADPASHEAAEPDPAPRQTPVANWLVAGLALLCLVESLIIAGLLASRVSVAAATQPRSAAAAATSSGTLSLNAVPWADVSLDGKSLGRTPVMNLSVSVGSHEVTWRHPQLGERRETVVVTATAPVTLVTDFRR